MKYRHNKRINTGLVYEMLVMSLAESFVEKDDEKSNNVLTLIKKYYSPGSVLAEENNIFSIILNNRVSSKEIAQKLISEAISYSDKLNTKNLSSTKSRLLRELDSCFAEKFFDRKIKNYQIYASVHQLIKLNESKSLSLEQSLVKFKLEERICDFLLNNKPDNFKSLETSKKYNNLVFRLVIENYNKKYKDKLTKNQKFLIKKLVESNDFEFKEAVLKIISDMNTKIKNYRYKQIVSENKVLSVKFDQITKKWKKDIVLLNKNPITEASLTTLLRYIGLLDEINR